MELDSAERGHAPRWRALRPSLLLVDDDLQLSDLLAYSLTRAGFEVSVALDGAAALRQFEMRKPDLVLLDIKAGAIGFDVLTSLRRGSVVPIIVVTEDRSVDDKVRAFGLGADDYVTKPFSHRELIARIGLQLRLSGLEWTAPEDDPEYLRVGPLTLDLGQHSLAMGEHHVALTRMEIRLLACLMAHPNEIVAIDAVVGALWPRGDKQGKATLQVLVHRLRRKLEPLTVSPNLVETIPAIGLRLVCPGDT